MKKLLAMIICAIGSTGWAGTFEVIGEGTATKPADFINLNIVVQSECHQTALGARTATDNLTQQALDVLKKFTANIPSQLQVSPGANEQHVKTIYVNNQNVIVCDEDHSWTSPTSIQFRLDDLKNLAALQDSLLQLNTARPPSTAINAERLNLTLAKPTPGVLAATWDAMSDLALQRAQQNALRQVMVLIQGTTPANIELQKVRAANNSEGQPIYDRVDGEGDTAGIGLGSVSVKIARQFVYKVR